MIQGHQLANLVSGAGFNLVTLVRSRFVRIPFYLDAVLDSESLQSRVTSATPIVQCPVRFFKGRRHFTAHFFIGVAHSRKTARSFVEIPRSSNRGIPENGRGRFVWFGCDAC